MNFCKNPSNSQNSQKLLLLKYLRITLEITILLLVECSVQKIPIQKKAGSLWGSSKGESLLILLHRNEKAIDTSDNKHLIPRQEKKKWPYRNLYREISADWLMIARIVCHVTWVTILPHSRCATIGFFFPQNTVRITRNTLLVTMRTK